jgi:hypothetical protein
LRAHEIYCLTRGDISSPLATVQQNFSEFFDAAGLSPFSISETSELAVFQERVSSCLAQSASTFPYLGRPDANLDDEIDRVWPGLQREVLTAVLACAMGAVRGSRLGLADQSGAAPSTELVIENLEAWSTELLTRLPLWLVRLNRSMVSFEEILFRLVDTSAFAKRAAGAVITTLDKLRPIIEGTEGGAEATVLRFQLEGLQASLCRVAQIQNPREVEWAQAFLFKELADPDSKFSYLRLTRTRLLQTITRKSAWDAAAKLLGSILLVGDKLEFEERTKHIESLRRATAEMGYSNLVDDLYRRGIGIGSADEASEDRPEARSFTIEGAWL